MHHRVIQRFIELFSDILFPPRDDAQRVRACTKDSVHALYAPHTAHNSTALMHYSHPTVRALIHEAKFHNNAQAHALLGSVLARHLTTMKRDVSTLILPMPLSPTRERARGYNQVTKIIICADTELLCKPKVLVRTHDTQPQTTLERHKRLENVASAFAVPHTSAHEIRDKHIILVDDVITTSATMHAAREALKAHNPASITCIALAH